MSQQHIMMNREDRNTLMERAKQADAYRRQGQIQRSIEELDDVITSIPGCNRTGTVPAAYKELATFAYTRRGVAKMALGFVSGRPIEKDTLGAIFTLPNSAPGAIEDLETAVRIDAQNGWALAQLGEAYRVFARNRFRWLSPQAFGECTDKALRAFEAAKDLIREHRAWLCAHQGAAYFASVFRSYEQAEGRFPDAIFQGTEQQELLLAREHLDQAKQALSEAIRLNPRYSWARRIYAVAVTLGSKDPGDYVTSMKNLSEALIDDPQASFYILRGVGMLSYYATRSRDPDTGQPDPATREILLRALRASTQVNQLDPEDYMAVYTHACASAALGHPYHKELCRNACDELMNAMTRIVTFLGRLLRLSGHDPERIRATTRELMQQAFHRLAGNMDTAMMIHSDPEWQKVVATAERAERSPARSAAFDAAAPSSPGAAQTEKTYFAYFQEILDELF